MSCDSSETQQEERKTPFLSWQGQTNEAMDSLLTIKKDFLTAFLPYKGVFFLPCTACIWLTMVVSPEMQFSIHPE